MVLGAVGLATGCGGPDPGASQSLSVLAASSLTRAFTAEARAFELEHPGVRVVLSFAGSQALVAQVREGAPASVLATADLATIQAVAGQLAGPPVVFAHNQLALVTSDGNPRGLRTLADLARPGVTVVLAAPRVPVGAASAAALRAASVSVTPVSWEDSVSGVVTKVRLDEADAGIAYVTDLRTPGVSGTPLPGTTTALAIAPVDPGPEAAQFIAFVRSAPGRRILREHGFR